jgi:hypothetical protein
LFQAAKEAVLQVGCLYRPGYQNKIGQSQVSQEIILDVKFFNYTMNHTLDAKICIQDIRNIEVVFNDEDLLFRLGHWVS